jgi:capsid protein
LPYEIVSGDLSSVTFASGRAGILEFRRQVEQVQYATLIPLFAQPILDRWLKIAAALGYVDAETERPRWACPSPQALDARAETLNDMLRVRCGFASRREIVEADGWDVSDIDRELAADQQRARSLGLILDVDSLLTQQGQTQPTPSQEQTQEQPVS